MKPIPTIPSDVRKSIEHRLTERFGAAVRIAEEYAFAPSSVFRCRLESSLAAVPETVVVRLARTGTWRADASLLDNERIALEYLDGIGSHVAPRFLAGGSVDGFVVSEDLGVYPSLLDRLLGDDAATASQGAIAFARSLGVLHAQTIGIAGIELSRLRLDLAAKWEHVVATATELGLPIPRLVEQDVTKIEDILSGTKGCIALSSGDPSVVNCKVIDGAVRFFDFESACIRHPLIDASVLRFLYPTGGPPWQLPQEIVLQMEAAYRTELAFCDDAVYEAGMAAAGAAWMIERLTRLSYVETGPDRDQWTLLPSDWKGPAPTRSRRRQLVAILETSTASMHHARRFDALADWSERLIESLRSRWMEATEPLPFYPAFKPG